MWPFTVGTFWLLFLSVRASFVMMALPTDKTFGFGPTRFCRMAKTLAIPAPSSELRPGFQGKIRISHIYASLMLFPQAIRTKLRVQVDDGHRYLTGL